MSSNLILETAKLFFMNCFSTTIDHFKLSSCDIEAISHNTSPLSNQNII